MSNRLMNTPNELHMMDDRFSHINESSLMNHPLRILTLARESITKLVYAIAVGKRKNRIEKTRFICISA